MFFDILNFSKVLKARHNGVLKNGLMLFKDLIKPLKQS